MVAVEAAAEAERAMEEAGAMGDTSAPDDDGTDIPESRELTPPPPPPPPGGISGEVLMGETAGTAPAATAEGAALGNPGGAI